MLMFPKRLSSNLAVLQLPILALLLIALSVTTSAAPARASDSGSEKRGIEDMALSAYCHEADMHETPLKRGEMSYKTVAMLASNRAMIEHPDVYKDPKHWLTKVIDVLDKYGDEPTSELCDEHPDS